MSNARKLLEDSIRAIDELIRDDALSKEVRLKLVRIRELLLRAEAEVISLHKRCSSLLYEAMHLMEHLDAQLVKVKGVQVGVATSKLKDKLLEVWELGKVLTLKEIEAMVGPAARRIVDDLLREGRIRITKVEWEGGEVTIYYKRVS